MKRIKQIIVIFFLTLSTMTTMHAQRSEVGIFAGGSFYLGDLNTQLFSQTKLSVGLLYRYNFNTHWALKSNLFYGKLQGDDAKHNNPRNLSFHSPLFDFSIQAEFNFLSYFTGSDNLYRWSPYILAGLSAFYFTPEALYKGNWVDLKSLCTEGQGLSGYAKPYSLFQMAIPFGIGVKYSLAKNLCLGMEWSMRRSFTDYVDDVSKTYVDPNLLSSINPLSPVLADRSNPPHEAGSARGISSNKDWYSFIGLFLTYKIDINKKACDL